MHKVLEGWYIGHLQEAAKKGLGYAFHLWQPAALGAPTNFDLHAASVALVMSF